MLSKPVRDVNVIIVTAVIKGCSIDLSKDTKTIYKKLFFSRKLFYTMIGKQEEFVLKKKPVYITLFDTYSRKILT